MSDVKPTPITVVVVDDTAAVREALRLVIDAHPLLHVVATAVDGADGIEVARRHRPDVILMDFKMPGMDGIGAARAIRNDLPDVGIVLLSAYDDPSLVRDATAAGVAEFLCKGVPGSVIHASLIRVASSTTAFADP